MKSWLKLPSFWLAFALTIGFLLFGLPTLFGAGSGFVQWLLGAAWAIVAFGLWVAVFKGAKTLKDSAHSLRDQGRDVRKNWD